MRAQQAREQVAKRRHEDMPAENGVDGPEPPGCHDRGERESQPAEDRRVLAHARRQGDSAGIAMARQDQDLDVAIGQRIEQVLIVTGDAAARAVAVADEGEDARGHRAA